MFQKFASNCLSDPALWIENETFTYEQVLKKIQEIELQLFNQGIRSEHRVAFVAETNFASVLAFLALIELGASICLLSTRLPAETIPSHLEKSRASFLLDPKTLLAKRCATHPSFLGNEILLFTSGSLGVPKLVSLKTEHFLESAKNSLSALGLSQKKGCWLLSVPLFHVSGLSILFRCFLSGSSIAFTSNLLAGHPHATHLSLVPTQLLRILQKKSPFPSLRCALIGGAPISENLIQLALQKKIPLYLTYGMTETASQITMTCSSDSLTPIHLGKPLPGKDVKISFDGEILVRGSSLFSGYDSPEGLQENRLDGGWFPTGDLGAWNLDGNLEYKGRKDNLFISGGENIYPETIEKALGSIPGVLRSVVVPINDLEFGNRPVAFVEMQIQLTKKNFEDLLVPLLPKFAIPIHFLPFPPEKNPQFKFKRSELAAWAEEFLLK